MAKSSKNEVAKRVDEIVKIILLGAEFADIREYAVEMKWGVVKAEDGTESGGISDTQLRRYQSEANDLIVNEAETDRKRLYRRHQAQRRMMFARAMESGDLRAALAIAKDEAELLGLYEMADAVHRPQTDEIAYANGFLLNVRTDGWKLFCQRSNFPPFTLCECLPGFDRLQRALDLAKSFAFKPDGMVNWLNSIRPDGAPEATEANLSSSDFFHS